MPENTIHFDRARIGSIEHKIANGNVTSRIKITATFTAKVAQALGARWMLFDRESLVKDGFKSVELEADIKNVRALLEIKGLRSLELISESANNFKVLRQGDGKKKAKRLAVQFRLQHAGSPFELLEHLIHVGGAEGALTITPLQVELFDGKAEVKGKTNGKHKPADAPVPPEFQGDDWRTPEQIEQGVPLHVGAGR